jgi:hypothetical protein
MTRSRPSPLLALLVLLPLVGGAAPAPLSLPAPSGPDEQARFLAGIHGTADAPLAALELTPRWRDHAVAMDAAWAKLSARLVVMQGWAVPELWPRIQGGLPLLYLFGGPDVANPITLYPDAPVYLLAGLEPVGRAPPPEALTPKAVGDALDALQEALRSVVPAAFFRTIEMGRDLRGQAIVGVQPLVYLFLARSGARILTADRIEIDPLGFAQVVPAGRPWGTGLQGLRVRYQLPGRLVQELVYVQVDLGNDAMERTPGFAAYVQGLGPCNAMLKAASFILHDNRFSQSRELLLRSAATVLQDDSGLPFGAFKKGEWDFKVFGTYLVPKEPFQRHWQRELAKLFDAAPPSPLPFRYGYRKGPEDSSLLFASKRVQAR